MPGLLIIRFSQVLGLPGRASAYEYTCILLHHKIRVTNYRTHASSICLGPIAFTVLKVAGCNIFEEKTVLVIPHFLVHVLLKVRFTEWVNSNRHNDLLSWHPVCRYSYVRKYCTKNK